MKVIINMLYKLSIKLGEDQFRVNEPTNERETRQKTIRVME